MPSVKTILKITMIKILAPRGSGILTGEGGFVNGYNNDIINDKYNASLPLSTGEVPVLLVITLSPNGRFL